MLFSEVLKILAKQSATCIAWLQREAERKKSRKTTVNIALDRWKNSFAGDNFCRTKAELDELNSKIDSNEEFERKVVSFKKIDQ